jgi:hypothetical protein
VPEGFGLAGHWRAFQSPTASSRHVSVPMSFDGGRQRVMGMKATFFLEGRRESAASQTDQSGLAWTLLSLVAAPSPTMPARLRSEVAECSPND